jgi:hypothetical protein
VVEDFAGGAETLLLADSPWVNGRWAKELTAVAAKAAIVNRAVGVLKDFGITTFLILREETT